MVYPPKLLQLMHNLMLPDQIDSLGALLLCHADQLLPQYRVCSLLQQVFSLGDLHDFQKAIGCYRVDLHNKVLCSMCTLIASHQNKLLHRTDGIF